MRKRIEMQEADNVLEASESKTGQPIQSGIPLTETAQKAPSIHSKDQTWITTQWKK
jgi:hypothetical protein